MRALRGAGSDFQPLIFPRGVFPVLPPSGFHPGGGFLYSEVAARPNRPPRSSQSARSASTRRTSSSPERCRRTRAQYLGRTMRNAVPARGLPAEWFPRQTAPFGKRAADAQGGTARETVPLRRTRGRAWTGARRFAHEACLPCAACVDCVAGKIDTPGAGASGARGGPRGGATASMRLKSAAHPALSALRRGVRRSFACYGAAFRRALRRVFHISPLLTPHRCKNPSWINQRFYKPFDCAIWRVTCIMCFSARTFDFLNGAIYNVA